MTNKEFLDGCSPDCEHIRTTGAMDFIKHWCNNKQCSLSHGNCDKCYARWLEQEYDERLDV